MVNDGNLTVNASWSTSSDPNVACTSGTPLGNNDPGHFVCVTVGYRFDPDIPFFNGNALNLTSTSKEVITD
jgi:hypothetical protein